MTKEELVALLEPAATSVADNTESDVVQTSIALSLKRLADVVCNPPVAFEADKLTLAQIEELRNIAGQPRGILIETPPSRVGIKTVEIHPETASAPEPSICLKDAAPGLYMFEGELIMRTEYRTEIMSGPAAGQYKPDCYIVASGEYFCGGRPGNPGNCRVTPVKVHLP